MGFILESATWRANPDWATKLGYSAEELAEINRKAIELLCDIRNEYAGENTRMVISGCIGPLNVLGGCCGTDHRHIEEICKAALVIA